VEQRERSQDGRTIRESGKIRNSRSNFEGIRLQLAGKTVLVTGAAKRIGRAIALRLHGAGANVVLHYRHAAVEAGALAAELNAVRAGSAELACADLLDTDRLPELVKVAVDRFGALDLLVNNASSFYPTPIGTITGQQFGELMGTNLKAPLFLAQAAAPHLKTRRGAIVNIVDIHAERPLRNYVVYSIAKSALAGLTRSLALELGPEVRVNGVAPGPIAWPEDGSFDAAFQERVIRHTMLKRQGDPDDVAKVVLFLATDAGYITGQIIAVDGGRSANI
jgi:pteridine reductase